MSTPKILLSRRAMLQMKSRYPKLFTPPKSSFKKKKEEPWPFYLQMVGYSALALAVPYSIGVVIMQSNKMKDDLEGEIGRVDGDETMGRKVVRLLRWYWGNEDEIPYVEYLERKQLVSKNEEEEYSLEIEDNKVLRKNQDRIERDRYEDIKVIVESEGMVKEDVFKGNASLTEQLISKDKNYITSSNVVVSIQDDESKEDKLQASNGTIKDTALDNFIDTPVMDKKNSSLQAIMDLATTYAMWNYFPPQEQTSVASSTGKTGQWSNSLQIRIDELQYTMNELQKSLNDPLCTRDRDDMEQEIKEIKKELGVLKREKRFGMLKKLVPF